MSISMYKLSQCDLMQDYGAVFNTRVEGSDLTSSKTFLNMYALILISIIGQHMVV